MVQKSHAGLVMVSGAAQAAQHWQCKLAPDSFSREKGKRRVPAPH